MPYRSRGALDGFRTPRNRYAGSLYRSSPFRDAFIASPYRYRVTLYRYGKALYPYVTVPSPFIEARDGGWAAPYRSIVPRYPFIEAPDWYREVMDEYREVVDRYREARYGYRKRAYRSGETLL
jgi:hypothetical protein